MKPTDGLSSAFCPIVHAIQLNCDNRNQKHLLSTERQVPSERDPKQRAAGIAYDEAAHAAAKTMFPEIA